MIKPPPKNINLSGIEMVNSKNSVNSTKSKAFKAAYAAASAAGAINDIDIPNAVGMYTLFTLGDSEGVVHYSVLASTTSSSAGAVVSFGKLKAHSSPVIQVLCTGDSVRPLWRIGTELDTSQNQVHL
jgi:hypothetical protein